MPGLGWAMPALRGLAFDPLEMSGRAGHLGPVRRSLGVVGPPRLLLQLGWLLFLGLGLFVPQVRRQRPAVRPQLRLGPGQAGRQDQDQGKHHSLDHKDSFL